MFLKVSYEFVISYICLNFVFLDSRENSEKKKLGKKRSCGKVMKIILLLFILIMKTLLLPGGLGYIGSHTIL